ncbi:MAG TPA: Gmad2 immunoglobulin-like domain-containing protein [Candidatus Paceibacterota bacterium]|nr:Gmad2 immunoglobulin-like domain-containing protein [Candidatus Paceibacterota bacterium]HMP18916.1 Gmad2 immunoglobulin-like domain-containing protein [Candidatus Paceibacterota bacterium]HMP85077.1 Gmad2 immunoglobulin-like domain-containing protein [Candidatus Paceibacterota bacterium]
MKNISIILVILLLILLGGILFFTNFQNSEKANLSVETPQQDEQQTGEELIDAQEQKKDLIVLDSPKANEIIKSPVTITGKARGYWFFEASFPIVIVDWNGLIIGEGFATAQDDWMTEDFVPFSATVTFDTTKISGQYSKNGSLILQKDNPSGLPEFDDALEIPIVFE